MSLLELPPETLLQIFDYVGSSYLRSDVSRLTVCKKWSKIAHTMCFRDFHVTQKTLRRLLSSLHAESSLRLVKDSVKTLDLNLKGFEDWDSIPLSRHDSEAADGRNASTWNGVRGRAVRTAWTTVLNIDLFYLANSVKQSRKLRILRIQATSELHPVLHLLERRNYLFSSTICAFLSASNLIDLDLDLCGTELMSYDSQGLKEGSHVCRIIAALLATLRRLRLRMRTICADVLKARPRSTNLRLEEMLINLSLSNDSPLSTSAGHAACCGPSMFTDNFLRLKADIEKEAQILVAQLPAPKIVRVLTHTYPNINLRAFDALTGRNVKLREGAEWDDDGEVIEDQVPDEESEISDLPSSDDE